jgi:hypothetical protein
MGRLAFLLLRAIDLPALRNSLLISGLAAIAAWANIYRNYPRRLRDPDHRTAQRWYSVGTAISLPSPEYACWLPMLTGLTVVGWRTR